MKGCSATDVVKTPPRSMVGFLFTHFPACTERGTLFFHSCYFTSPRGACFFITPRESGIHSVTLNKLKKFCCEERYSSTIPRPYQPFLTSYLAANAYPTSLDKAQSSTRIAHLFYSTVDYVTCHLNRPVLSKTQCSSDCLILHTRVPLRFHQKHTIGCG